MERAAGFDVVAAALQGDIDGAQCVAALKARLPGAWAATNVNCSNSHLVVFARSTAVVKDSVKAVAAPKAAVVTATLRSGAKLAFCAVCAGDYDQPLSTDQGRTIGSETSSGPPRPKMSDDQRSIVWRGPRLLIGDLGFGASAVGEAASRELIRGRGLGLFVKPRRVKAEQERAAGVEWLGGVPTAGSRRPPIESACWRGGSCGRSSPQASWIACDWSCTRPEICRSEVWAGRRGCRLFPISTHKSADAATRGDRLSFFESFPETRSVVAGRTASGGQGRRTVTGKCRIASHLPRTGTPPRTSDRGLEADGDSLEEGEPAATSIWTSADDKKLDSLRGLADPDDDADHITVRVLRRVWREDKQAYEDNGVLIGAALLSGRGVGSTDFEERGSGRFQEPPTCCEASPSARCTVRRLAP